MVRDVIVAEQQTCVTILEVETRFRIVLVRGRGGVTEGTDSETIG
jgi:hypothetical protein